MTAPKPRFRRLYPFLLAATLTGSFAFSVVVPVHACSCMQPGPPAAELEKSDAVFLGRVVSVELHEQEVGEIRGILARKHVTFELGKVWKGCPEGETVTVITAAHGAACGYGFEEGESYLVYAYEVRRDAEGGAEESVDAPQLTTNLCTRNAPRERADEDLEALGEPVRVVSAGSSGAQR